MGISDITSKIKTTRPAIPQIYAYTTPEIARHNGWTKIGYTEQDVQARVKQQTHTADVQYVIEWNCNALFEDGSGTFRDTDFHGYLRKLDIRNEQGTEWFAIEPIPAKHYLYEFRENHGVLQNTPETIEYELRKEQDLAVVKTLEYASENPGKKFLWNAKPRFGKTLTTYDLCKRLGAEKVLILTNRPAIANAWYDDYVKFIGTSSGYHFVSTVDALHKKTHVKTYSDYKQIIEQDPEAPRGLIEFVSLQDLKGSARFGGKYEKLHEIAQTEWDLLVVDEAHEGVDTDKSDFAFDVINTRFTLHLSGTPFKAIANEQFDQDAIFNWTYADEQQAKAAWGEQENPNPYSDLPQLNMLTYKMSDIAIKEAQRGLDIEGETVAYAFDLNEFFSTNKQGSFKYAESVDKFLDALTKQTKFPFSTPELRDELRHTLWLLNRVDSAKALEKKLKNHPVFKDYKVIAAVGDGKSEDDTDTLKVYDKVKQAIATHDKTITLSVGQLTTGVTIPEWTGVLMLSNIKSPSLYMQAAFRAQNPCLFNRGGSFLRKENAYVFDFDPARTLTIFEEFANDLYSDTASGGGDVGTRTQRIKTLLNFFPVLGEDEDGRMIELDAERVLSIPRKIRSQEVVRCGFMSNFLFQDVGRLFNAPAQVLEIVKGLETCKGADKGLSITQQAVQDLCLDDQGEVNVPEEQVELRMQEIFGNKIYATNPDYQAAVKAIESSNDIHSGTHKSEIEQKTSTFVKESSKVISTSVTQSYDNLKPAQAKAIERKVKQAQEKKTKKAAESYQVTCANIERERKERLAQAKTEEEANIINAECNTQADAALQEMVEAFKSGVEETQREAIREAETLSKEDEKRGYEEEARSHLRGFSRCIPSFLMAYGTDETTLENFDTIIPDSVFKEVTSISTEQFRFLRDGGDFVNAETGQTEHFDGGLFDSVVFNDSVKEFIRLRRELANYFDENLSQDIFDYIPPQKTNQIYTPRKVVVDMVDMFQAENPGCFDDPSHTFADLYMKSGLFITEIIKRLYQSPKMQELFPCKEERLQHILENQVFGIAPTEIIYQIATHFILGAENEIGKDYNTNFVCADTAAMAKDGTLAQFVEKTFGNKLVIEDESAPEVESKSLEVLCESESIQGKTQEEKVGDWILAALEHEGIEYVDRRASGGSLWVIGDKSIQVFMRRLESRGARFSYSANGGKASGGRPAWYIPASVAERALRKH